MKKAVAKVLSERVSDGDVVGLGSGSTAECVVDAIGARIRSEGIRVSGVPTSHRTAMHAEQAGINVISALGDTEISWAFDGADEVDPDFNMIKGNGAAMLNEKIIAMRAKKLVIVVTEDKLVEKLGSKFPIPVEVIPEAVSLVKGELQELGASEVVLRAAEKKYGPVITEHNNLVLDARFSDFNPEELEEKIKCITGVVESGLFTGFGQELLVAGADNAATSFLNPPHSAPR